MAAAGAGRMPYVEDNKKLQSYSRKDREVMTNTLGSAVRQRVREHIYEEFLFGDIEKAFADSDSFIEKGILDSTGILELIEFLEQDYGIRIAEEETIPENLGSIDNVVRFIERKAGLG